MKIKYLVIVILIFSYSALHSQTNKLFSEWSFKDLKSFIYNDTLKVSLRINLVNTYLLTKDDRFWIQQFHCELKKRKIVNNYLEIFDLDSNITKVISNQRSKGFNGICCEPGEISIRDYLENPVATEYVDKSLGKMELELLKSYLKDLKISSDYKIYKELIDRYSISYAIEIEESRIKSLKEYPPK